MCMYGQGHIRQLANHRSLAPSLVAPRQGQFVGNIAEASFTSVTGARKNTPANVDWKERIGPTGAARIRTKVK